MEIGQPGFDTAGHEGQLYWMVVIHLTFVISGVLLATMDWMISRSARH